MHHLYRKMETMHSRCFSAYPKRNKKKAHSNQINISDSASGVAFKSFYFNSIERHTFDGLKPENGFMAILNFFFNKYVRPESMTKPSQDGSVLIFFFFSSRMYTKDTDTDNFIPSFPHTYHSFEKRSLQQKQKEKILNSTHLHERKTEKKRQLRLSHTL
eukprot:TRINITY_DN7315_c0_g2_i1.p2 TRINITY_DN7315_c0_g2~~TRINITY_DN7315_c0_g2_i1.p2  ORF type:complete len:159 (-),score=25.58 TRINITY_DN7315_c0_g2_i1:29-505(-)